MYTFAYAKGASYRIDDPGARVHCYIRNEQYDSWLKASHRAVAGCNDRHTPHNLIGKYLVKANNGFWHSCYFTTLRFHQPIQINAINRWIAEAACGDCGTSEIPGGRDPVASSVQYTHCNSDVPLNTKCFKESRVTSPFN
ncbi:MAG TPA: cytochrome c nitrite reductase small subunit [bacterium]